MEETNRADHQAILLEGTGVKQDPPKKNTSTTVAKKDGKKGDDASVGDVGKKVMDPLGDGFWENAWYSFNARTWTTENGSTYLVNKDGIATMYAPIYGEINIGPGGVAKGGARWIYGAFKSEAKWASQLSKRGWTAEQITQAVTKGKSFEAINMVNKANGAKRFVHPTTGQSVVVDKVTKELLHVGGPGFKY